jgi:hypothetical protein
MQQSLSLQATPLSVDCFFFSLFFFESVCVPLLFVLCFVPLRQSRSEEIGVKETL